MFVESGGDNLAATFSPELSDLTLYVIDVAAGDKIPRKGGPGITRSDLLVINKIDLAPMVGASLEVMDRDARRMRGERPFVFTNLKTGTGLDTVIRFVIERGMVDASPRPPSALSPQPRASAAVQIGARAKCVAPFWNGDAASPSTDCAVGNRILVSKQWISMRRSGAWHGSCDAALRGRRAVFADATVLSFNPFDTGKSMQRRTVLKRLALSAALALAGLAVGTQALAADTIKVGVLHSLSGTMAISETVLKDVDADDDRRDQRQGRRAWARSSSRSSSIPRRTGRCSPRRRAS